MNVIHLQSGLRSVHAAACISSSQCPSCGVRKYSDIKYLRAEPHVFRNYTLKNTRNRRGTKERTPEMQQHSLSHSIDIKYTTLIHTKQLTIQNRPDLEIGDSTLHLRQVFEDLALVLERIPNRIVSVTNILSQVMIHIIRLILFWQWNPSRYPQVPRAPDRGY